ncbi:MAG: hydrogenase iron-sulfur subunit [Candidatus Lokiarchaeota archaeon]|nr:hydrogenase iron-sulfur subunit [Candidatus Lokiarchaeota archaeon]
MEENILAFKPKIVGFLCNWCSYAGADLAGVSRIQYPPNIRIIRLMCSGRVEPFFVFEALKQGIDGIIIMGCHPGECHYMSGNYEAEIKFNFIKKMLNFINLSDRITLKWVSASEGIRFAKVVTEFTEFIKTLGKSPIQKSKNNSDLIFSLTAMQQSMNNYRMRVLMGRKRKITEQKNVYGEKVSIDEFEELENKAIIDEYNRERISLILKKHPLSVKNLASSLDLDEKSVLDYIVWLRSKGIVDVDKIQGLTPYYISIQED